MYRKNNKKRFGVFLIAVFTPIFIIFSLFHILTLPVDDSSTGTVAFNIKRGETIDSIGKRLKASNLIRSPAALKIIILQYNLAKRIQAGDYQLSPSWKLTDIAKTFTLGRSDIKITVYEGLRREEIADLLSMQFEQNGLNFDKQDFLDLTIGKEGYLFPDTYFLPKTATAETVAVLMQASFEKQVDAIILMNIKRQNLTLDQALILASLVEREAKLDKDRPIVAGIIIKRWQNDWSLEIDATVQYAIGYQKKTDSWWKQNLTKQDLEIKSPFNTYLYPGLPPSPICNPSLSSIEAVSNQQQTSYWFYLSDNDGNLHFSETLKEHNSNIAKYLKK